MRRSTEPQENDSVTLENLVFGMLLSAAFLIYGAYGLYKNDLVLPTRVGIQHLQDNDAIAFYAAILIAVPTNAIKLREWMKHGDGKSNAFQTADFILQITMIAYVIYNVFDLFS